MTCVSNLLAMPNGFEIVTPAMQVWRVSSKRSMDSNEEVGLYKFDGSQPAKKAFCQAVDFKR